jgi:hypothetical protein
MVHRLNRKGGSALAREQVSDQELMRLVIEEVDQARDIYQLAQQLAPFLPIRSVDELIKATGEKEFRFRDSDFVIDEAVGANLPRIIFPVEDVSSLVERLGHVVRMVPPALGVDLESPEGIRRRLRFAAALGPNLGMIETGNVVASAIMPGMAPPDLSQQSSHSDR